MAIPVAPAPSPSEAGCGPQPQPSPARAVRHGAHRLGWAVLDDLRLEAGPLMRTAVALFRYVRHEAVDAEPEARATQGQREHGGAVKDA